MKYINVIGGSNSGKSTFSKKLAKKLNIAHIELDEINWKPDWQMTPPDVFQKEVSKVLDVNDEGWVVDGSYSKRLQGLVQDKADTIIFLKIPLFITLPRQFKKSARRILKKEELWNGNQESIKNSLLLTKWVIKSHQQRIQRMKELGQKVEKSGRQYLVFTSNVQADNWLDELDSD